MAPAEPSLDRQSGTHRSRALQDGDRTLIDESGHEDRLESPLEQRSALLRRLQQFDVSRGPRFDPGGLPPASLPARQLVRDCGCQVICWAHRNAQAELTRCDLGHTCSRPPQWADHRLLAVGFVLVYKANRFLNLAGAQLGVLSAVLLLKVVNDWGWNWWGSFVGCVAVGIATGLLVERFFVGPVRRKTKAPVRLLILTIGVSQVLLALTYIPGLTPTSQAPFPQPFTSHLQIGGVVLSGMSVLTMILVPVLLVLLWVFLEFSSTGKQIRAAAGNPDAARLCGISVNRVSLITWGIAGGLSAFAAVLNGPTTTSFNAQAAGPYLLMLTMGAAAFGAFVSFPVAVAGGIGLGLVYQVVAAETNNAGTAELAVFGVILLAILVRGRAIGRAFAAEGAAVPERPGLRVPEVLKNSMLLRHGMKWLIGVSLVVAVAFPLLPYFKSNQFLLVLVLVYALVGVSLTMLVGWSGQVSLGHFALVGIAAYLTARWAGEAGWSVVELLVVTGVVGAAVMVAIGLPALRVRGLTLAVTTLGLAVIAPDWLYLQSWVGGATPFTTPVQVTSRSCRAVLATSARSSTSTTWSWSCSSWSWPPRRRCADRRSAGSSSQCGTTSGPARRSGSSRRRSSCASWPFRASWRPQPGSSGRSIGRACHPRSSPRTSRSPSWPSR